jgi:hypothetical protein
VAALRHGEVAVAHLFWGGEGGRAGRQGRPVCLQAGKGEVWGGAR